jgi:hypothetical protein
VIAVGILAVLLLALVASLAWVRVLDREQARREPPRMVVLRPKLPPIQVIDVSGDRRAKKTLTDRRPS